MTGDESRRCMAHVHTRPGTVAYRAMASGHFAFRPLTDLKSGMWKLPVEGGRPGQSTRKGRSITLLLLVATIKTNRFIYRSSANKDHFVSELPTLVTDNV
jgi:hypothetical protein